MKSQIILKFFNKKKNIGLKSNIHMDGGTGLQVKEVKAPHVRPKAVT